MAGVTSNDVYVANTTFATSVDGVPVVVVKGRDRVRSGHVLLAQNPEYFEPVDLLVHYDVEQATASPGEPRATVVPTPKAEPDDTEPKGSRRVKGA